MGGRPFFIFLILYLLGSVGRAEPFKCCGKYKVSISRCRTSVKHSLAQINRKVPLFLNTFLRFVAPTGCSREIEATWSAPEWNGGYPLDHYMVTLQRALGERRAPCQLGEDAHLFWERWRVDVRPPLRVVLGALAGRRCGFGWWRRRPSS